MPQPTPQKKSDPMSQADSDYPADDGKGNLYPDYRASVRRRARIYEQGVNKALDLADEEMGVNTTINKNQTQNGIGAGGLVSAILGATAIGALGAGLTALVLNKPAAPAQPSIPIPVATQSATVPPVAPVPTQPVPTQTAPVAQVHPDQYFDVVTENKSGDEPWAQVQRMHFQWKNDVLYQKQTDGSWQQVPGNQVPK